MDGQQGPSRAMARGQHTFIGKECVELPGPLVRDFLQAKDRGSTASHFALELGQDLWETDGRIQVLGVQPRKV